MGLMRAHRERERGGRSKQTVWRLFRVFLVFAVCERGPVSSCRRALGRCPECEEPSATWSCHLIALVVRWTVIRISVTIDQMFAVLRSCCLLLVPRNTNSLIRNVIPHCFRQHYWVLFQTPCYRPEGRGFNSRSDHWIFLNLPNPSSCIVALGLPCL
jgi:hypothetical protein